LISCENESNPVAPDVPQKGPSYSTLLDMKHALLLN
jgi:hypothetical protein